MIRINKKNAQGKNFLLLITFEKAAINSGNRLYSLTFLSTYLQNLMDNQTQTKLQVLEPRELKEPTEELKGAPFEVDYEGSVKMSAEVPPIEDLLKFASECIMKIENLKQEVNLNRKLDKFFDKARVTNTEIFNSLQKIEEEMVKVKYSIEKPEANLAIITEIVVFLNNLLDTYTIKAKDSIDKAIWILEFDTKVSCCMQFITHSMFLPHDITTLPRKNYTTTWLKIRTEVLGNVKKMQQNFAYVKKVVGITTSAVLNETECDWAISKLVSFGLSYPKYFLSDKQGQLRAMIFYRNPTVAVAKQIWNLPENGMTRELAKINLKNIKTNIKIYVPFEQGKEPTNICVDDGKSIQVRILHHESLHVEKDLDKTLSSSKSSGIGCLCAASNGGDEENVCSTVILHMHGGGFIALSSRSMQNYTRQWARSLKVPVFSVDYRMPSEHPFPTAPYDCLRVYQFLINSVHKFMNVRPKRIILAGDSAGGNLAFSLMGLILKNKLPPPVGIFAAYPACDLRLHFSPSKIHAFTDPLLNPPMLLLCLKEYLGTDPQQQLNPLATPLLLTEQFVGGKEGDKRFPLKWPKTIIQVGAKDPLYDDSLRMAERLVRSGVQVDVQVYQNLSHGFLNLDFVVGECRKTIKDSIDHLQTFIKPNKVQSTMQ